jgi:hypothetical protein
MGTETEPDHTNQNVKMEAVYYSETSVSTTHSIKVACSLEASVSAYDSLSENPEDGNLYSKHHEERKAKTSHVLTAKSYPAQNVLGELKALCCAS